MDPSAIMRPLFGASAIVAGTATVVRSWRNGQRVVKALAWPTTTGRIVASHVVQERHGGSGGATYAAHIEYEYEVDGRPLRSRRICVGGELNTSFKSRAENRCAMYPTGAEVDVFYDPERPEHACLERSREGAGLMLLLGNGFVVFGLLMLAGVIGPD
ncbi:MAG: DUF3592 domain-containing protein [Planctomycetota bacterium]|jgi:hypothetical protein